ncbi:RhaT Permeases of the drug/metabolite transporter (DMT) superfamily [Rhabdaerophilaceae bacterium]
MVNRGMNPREWGLLLLLSLLWGGSFFFIGVAIKTVPPVSIVFLRMLIAAIALVFVVLLWRIPVRISSDLVIVCAGMSVLNNVIPFCLITWAQGSIPSGLASVLNATTPIFIVIVLHCFAHGERASWLKVAGVAAGFAGVAVMIGTDALGRTDLPILPQLAILVAALSYAVSGLWSRRIARTGAPPLVIAAGQLCISTLLLGPIMILADRPWTLPFPGYAALLAIVALALVSTALAYSIYFRILATAGAINLSLVTFLIPVSAILLGTLFLDEVLGLRHFVGVFAIGAGLTLIDGRLPRRLGAHLQRRTP